MEKGKEEQDLIMKTSAEASRRLPDRKSLIDLTQQSHRTSVKGQEGIGGQHKAGRRPLTPDSPYYPGGQLAIVVENHSDGMNFTTTTSSRAKRRKLTTSSSWEVDFVTTDPRSPLANVPIKKILADPRAWDALEPQQQQELVINNPALFQQQLDGSFKPIPGMLVHNDNMSSAVATYQNNLTSGRNDPQWQKDAMTASIQRANGEFDEFKEQQFEAFWGQHQDFPAKVTSCHTTKDHMEKLFVGGDCFKPGDFIRHTRIADVGGHEVHLYAKFVSFEHSTLTFEFMPSMTRQYSMNENDKRVATYTGNVSSVRDIWETMEAHDAEFRSTHDINNKANEKTTALRVIRNGEDLGRFSDIRQAYSFKTVEGDYLSALTGMNSFRNRRAGRNSTSKGYFLLTHHLLVRKVKIANILRIPRLSIVPICPELQAKLAETAAKLAPNHVYLVVDYRLLNYKGYNGPHNASVEDVETLGPLVFETEFCQRMAATHSGALGRSWSKGHAFVDAEVLKSIPAQSQHDDGYGAAMKETETTALARLFNKYSELRPPACVRIWSWRPMTFETRAASPINSDRIIASKCDVKVTHYFHGDQRSLVTHHNQMIDTNNAYRAAMRSASGGGYRHYNHRPLDTFAALDSFDSSWSRWVGPTNEEDASSSISQQLPAVIVDVAVDAQQQVAAASVEDGQQQVAATIVEEVVMQQHQRPQQEVAAQLDPTLGSPPSESWSAPDPSPPAEQISVSAGGSARIPSESPEIPQGSLLSFYPDPEDCLFGHPQGPYYSS